MSRDPVGMNRPLTAVVPLGNQRYIIEAQERVEGPIQAACALCLSTRERLATPSNDHFSLLVLVLTTDELRLFTERYGAGWRGRLRGALDTEVLRLPLAAVKRCEHRRSMLKATLRLTLTDGNQVTLRVAGGRSPEHGVEVFDLLTELIAAAPRSEPVEDSLIVDRRKSPLTMWQLAKVLMGTSLVLILYLLIERLTGG